MDYSDANHLHGRSDRLLIDCSASAGVPARAGGAACTRAETELSSSGRGGGRTESYERLSDQDHLRTSDLPSPGPQTSNVWVTRYSVGSQCRVYTTVYTQTAYSKYMKHTVITHAREWGGVLTCRNHWSLGQNCTLACEAQPRKSYQQPGEVIEREGGGKLRRGGGHKGTARLAEPPDQEGNARARRARRCPGNPERFLLRQRMGGAPPRSITQEVTVPKSRPRGTRQA